MNKERLIDLADRLETVPKENFNLATWGNNSFIDIARYASSFPEPTISKLTKPHNCGAYACACGWLTIFHPTMWYYSSDGTLTYKDPDTKDLRPINFGAIESYFDILQHQAAALFHNREQYYTYFQHDYEVTPRAVAKAIRKFVAEKENYYKEE